MRFKNSYAAAVAAAIAAVVFSAVFQPTEARAVTIDWVTVGDPGNAADTTSYGAVAENFRIMKYEWTNAQYVNFLNAVDPDGTSPQGIYNPSMGSDARGGISFTSGNAAGSKYAARTNWGDKPVNFVTVFDAARVANWLQNGAQTYGSTNSSASAPQNTGAYTIGTATTGVVTRNSGANYWIPTENEWYKAAYYVGGGTNAGYWDYATQSDTLPTSVTANSTGIGSAGSTGNFANFGGQAVWDGRANATTVGTNGGPSAYGAFDMTGNVWEWFDGSSVGIRGGPWKLNGSFQSSSFRAPQTTSNDFDDGGFRLVAVPEPTQLVFVAGVGAALGAWRLRKIRRNGSGS